VRVSTSSKAVQTPEGVDDGAMASSGGVSRVAKGADCKSAALWLRRFESCLPHHFDFTQQLALTRYGL
jgi:hypothetical protein